MNGLLTMDLPGIPKKVGRPKTSKLNRAAQLRRNQKAYRARQKAQMNIDNALSK